MLVGKPDIGKFIRYSAALPAFPPLKIDWNIGMLEFWNNGFWPSRHRANSPARKPHGLEVGSERSMGKDESDDT
jgi:hypothetical protein